MAGPDGTSNIWDNISNGQYVSDAYIYTGSDGYIWDNISNGQYVSDACVHTGSDGYVATRCA